MKPALFLLHSQIEQEHWWFVARRRIMQRIVHEILPPSKDKLIIDVGCGTGGNIASLNDEYTCIGIDTTSDAIGFARSRFPSVRFVHGLFPQDVAQDAARADLLICMDVIEHVERDREFVENLISPLCPGAQLLITVPADMSLWGKHDESNHHFRRYDTESLQKLLRGLPVTARLMGYFNSRLYPLVKLVRRAGRLRRSTYGESGTDFSHPPRLINGLLRNVFAGEADCLLKNLDKPQPDGYRRGVSLIAVLRRDPVAVT